MILEFNNFKNICCDFNLELEICYSNNYITAKYNARATYGSGFKNFKVCLFLLKEKE